MTGKLINSFITIGIGCFFTVIAIKPITKHRPPAWDIKGLKKWENAQKLYKIGGPIILISGLAMLLSELF